MTIVTPKGENMKKIIFCLLLVSSQMSAEEPAPQQSIENSFGYVDVGFEVPIIPIPALGLGYRKQWDHDGLDLSFRVASLGELITQAKASASFLHYFNPNLEGEYYWGIGLGVSWIKIEVFKGAWRNSGGTLSGQSVCLSPEFIFGKQFKTSSGGTRFWQFQTSFPTYAASNPHYFTGGHLCHQRWLLLPLITFSYGFGF